MRELSDEEKERRDLQTEKMMRDGATHSWDGPTVPIHTADVPTCSRCGTDMSDDGACPGIFPARLPRT